VKPPVSILLPGLHGTVDLFPRFAAVAPAGYRVHCQPLPAKIVRGYHELAEWVLERLPPEPVVLIAESFSGPLAILVADRCPRVAGVVLSATFVERPFPGFLSHVPAFMWSVSPPILFLSAMLTGGDRALAKEIQRTIATVDGEVLRSRAAAALHVDVRVELARYSRPLLYLRGTRDRLIGAHSAARVRALKPSTLVVAIDAPHMLLECRPVEAWAHIKSFVESSDVRMTG
jgi:pimeloyl-[acyl-carrier protein] methyl ester esterase